MESKQPRSSGVDKHTSSSKNLRHTPNSFSEFGMMMTTSGPPCQSTRLARTSPSLTNNFPQTSWTLLCTNILIVLVHSWDVFFPFLNVWTGRKKSRVAAKSTGSQPSDLCTAECWPLVLCGPTQSPSCSWSPSWNMITYIQAVYNCYLALTRTASPGVAVRRVFTRAVLLSTQDKHVAELYLFSVLLPDRLSRF